MWRQYAWKICRYELEEVLDLAIEMAHTFLEGASLLRAGGNLKEHEDVFGEGMACRFFGYGRRLI